MKRITIVLLFFFVLISTGFSQTDSVRTTLSEIVTTANRVATPYYALGSSVSVVTSEMIDQRQLKTVVDILREVPGLTIVQQGGPGKNSVVFMRGANSNHTLVTLDGIKLNDPSSPSNYFDFSSLNSNDIERIEVIRGPQSTLYGSDAIAGIINIISKKGNDSPSLKLNAEGGSNSYYRTNLSATGSYNIIHYSVFATQTGSDGVSAANSIYGNNEKDAFTNSSVTSSLDFSLPENIKLGLFYKFTKTNADLDQNEKFGDDPNFSYKLEEHIWKTSITKSFFNDLWTPELSFSNVRRFGNTLDLVDDARKFTSSDAYNYGERTKLNLQNVIKIASFNTITLGIESENEKANTSYYSTSDWGPFDSVFPSESITTTGIYLQNQLSVANSLFTTIGLRYDDNTKFGQATTYRIAPAYFISSTGSKIKFSYGTGFKAPSLFYLFDPSFGNPDLKPEESKGFDFGFEQFFSNPNISFGVTYFSLKLENMFGYDSNFKTVNIAEASSKGIELTLSADPISKIKLNGSYTFTETKDETESSEDFEKALLRRPKHQASFSINYIPGNMVNLNLQINYVGKRDDKDFGMYPVQRVELPDYLLVNFAASYKLWSSLTLTARIENLLDRQYEEVLYYGTLGRSIYAGINLNL